ncbi:methyltransferase domain-containing protein [Thermocatellispora tengchongensis]|uniref:hypothetical protein n=1 Tax=Thermocatellispora tengchongensis TaxID=1073253 RepID=UPI00363326F3
MHVTCGVRRVPYAWVGQCRPGGVIVLPWCPNFGENHALRLVVTPDGVAHGRFPRFASYMMMRSQRSAHQAEGAERCSRTPVDPRTIAYAPAGADLAVAAITGLRSTTTYLADGGFRLWLHDPDDGGRWARVTWEAGRQDFEVVQAGDRSVWEEVVEAYFRWVEWGEPDRDRFGMTVRPDGRRVWLDTPERVIA